MGIAYNLRRPVRLVRNLLVDRNQPDLETLARIRDPERFVWSILPHAARTFSSSIALLPRTLAEASAVAYLYCRMLDTYEDLVPDPDLRDAALTTFATRLETGAPAPCIETDRARDRRDAAHLLLVRRCGHVDHVYGRLAADVQRLVRRLVQDMATGMRWSSTAFDRQGGALESEEQLTRYCRNVLGGPVVFSARLLSWHRSGTSLLPPSIEADALAVGEMIQLANVTRDIEKDLARGIAYHPALRDDIGSDGAVDAARTERIRAVRGTLMDAALRRAPAYRRLVDYVSPHRFSMSRASAVLMLLFTDRYFSQCATRAERPSWGRRRSGARLLATALPAACSRRWAARILARIEADFLRAAAARPTG